MVARWTASHGINLANKAAIIVPVLFKASTPGGDHWFLLVATDMSENNPSVTILNSMPGYGDDRQAAEALIEYLRIECEGQMRGNRIRLCEPRLPIQSTHNDCGAFAVLYQRHLLQDIDEFKVPHCIHLKKPNSHPTLFLSQRGRDQASLGDWFCQSAVLRERSRIAEVIRSQSSPTAVFPNLSLPEEEVEEKAASNNRQERVSKKPAAFKLGNSNADEIIPIALFRWQTFTRPGSFL